MRKTQVLTIAVAFLVVSPMAAPAMAGTSERTDNKLTGAASGAFGFISADVPSNAALDANGNPSWFIYVEDGSESAVSEWANQSSSRIVRDVANNSNRVLVSAPPSHIGGTLIARTLNNGLLSQSYVEAVSLDIRMELVEPLTNPLSESEFRIPWDRKLGIITARGDAALPTDGVAFSDDVNETTSSDVINATGARSVHNSGINGTGIEIAVIDTGANVKSGQVFGNGTAGSNVRISHAENTITGAVADVENNSYAAVADGNGHGSWVGSAAAGAEGMAPNATLQIYKALNDDGSGSTADIVAAIESAEANGADVIAMSLGSPVSNAALSDAVRNALAGNVTLVSVAAGNSRQTTRWVASPADVGEAGVVAVAAATTGQPANVSSAYFSNVGPDNGVDKSMFKTRGAMPDISAPGFEVSTPVVTSDGTLINKTLSGTSMSQPFVAGGAALLLDAEPGLRNESTKAHNRLLDTAAPAENMGVTETGHGYLNVSNLIENDQPTTRQALVRTEAATQRDYANIGLAGYVDGHLPQVEVSQ